jgi:alkylated DNA repair dioxygenase AlkB
MYLENNIPLEDGRLVLFSLEKKDYFPPYIFPALRDHTPWKQEEISIYGKKILQPRLTCWYGTKGYEYSGIKNYPQMFTPLLNDLKKLVEGFSKENFNSVLLNYYRNGNDSVGFHSDDESELGENPSITSMSFGGTREFVLKHKYKELAAIKLLLNHGDILIMGGELQKYWKHAILKEKNCHEGRINLTFRRILD